MKTSRLFSPNVTLEIHAADPIRVLKRLNQQGIILENIRFIDAFAFQIEMNERRLPSASAILKKYAEDYRVIRCSTQKSSRLKIKNRPVLFVSVIALLFLVFYLPSRVLFVQVSGNEQIPSRQIIEAAKECGIYFGASRKEVRSEQVKNALIERIPSLLWVGVNTDGCVAVISVRERTVSDEESQKQGDISSIVAVRDGVILSCTVLQGTPRCKTGQAVTAGEVLVSGYTDCGSFIRAECADAEVLARTTRELSLVAPDQALVRRSTQSQSVRYRIRIGKKLINLYKYSGIPDATCDKIYCEYQLTLPGGFVLPVALIREEAVSHTTEEIQVNDFSWLEDCACAYLKEQMVAGQIIGREVEISQTDGAACLYGRYDCTEMIGKRRFEEITEDYGHD